MNIIYLILMSQFVFIKGGNVLSDNSLESALSVIPLRPVSAGHPSIDPIQPLDHIKLKIIHDDEVILQVNLIQTNRVLANKHLPVWISKKHVDRDTLHNEDDHSLKRLNGLMEQLGEFTIYQDPISSSAAVYFHKQQEFDGSIGYGFLIRKLSIHELHPTDETSLILDEHGVYSRLGYEGHSETEIKVDDSEAGVNYQAYTKTYRGRVYDGYPEVLVIVSWDAVEFWVTSLDESDWFSAIVSHVLTLFNGVDMLYSKLKNTKVQINIAGIIIEGAQSFMFLGDCYYPISKEDEEIEYRLDGKCVCNLLRLYLYARRKEIPLDSYDIVVHLTRGNLYHRQYDDSANEIDGSTDISLDGIADSITDLYKSRCENCESILIASIGYADYLENYPTIAHEMAHLMTVKHDKPEFFTQDKMCCGHILKPVSGWCDKCITWSEISEMTFKLFFSSPNCCSFINKPRSLNPPGRREILTANEQCQCYGYESARIFGTVRDRYCQSGLQCKATDHAYIETVKPMDGTPCDNNKVCWQQLCEETENHKKL